MEPLYNNVEFEKFVKFSAYGGEVFLFLVMILYMVFAFILIRRVKIMNLNLNTPNKKLFTFLAWVHFFASVVVIVLAFLSLKI